MSFWVKTKWYVKLLFPKYVWAIPTTEKKVYLTFDDGPTPEITAWVLSQLEQYNAKATFFCIGNNIQKHPEIFKKVLAAEHAIGNHTYNHLKGWETATDEYVENVKLCQSAISNQQSTITNLFRPPYGKIKNSQANALQKLGYQIIMWDVLSRDYDADTSPEQCLANVLKNVTAGSIIVFHDSVKAEQNLKYVLPKTLAYLQGNGFVCAKLTKADLAPKQ
jgi:peptidoglycan/xylan/chitin deacetylase (PgdA/CDA1 family)